jgi:hypothetical protein
MDKIRSLGLDKDTYVFWTTDNGAWQDVYPDASYTPYRGTKGTDRERRHIVEAADDVGVAAAGFDARPPGERGNARPAFGVLLIPGANQWLGTVFS